MRLVFEKMHFQLESLVKTRRSSKTESFVDRKCSRKRS